MNDKPATNKKKFVCNEWDVGFGGLRGDEVGMNDSCGATFFLFFYFTFIGFSFFDMAHELVL